MSLCVLSACKPSIEENTLDLSVAYDKAPVQVSYEMESISFTELVSKNTSTEFLYKIAAKPNVTHLKVYAGIFEDGTSEWVMEHLVPTFKIPSAQSEIPQDDSPQTRRTHIKNGIGYFYDLNDKLIRSQAVPMRAFNDLVELLKNDQKRDKATVAARIIAGGNINVEQRLAEARAKGYIVTDIPASMTITIRSTVDRNTVYPNQPYDPAAPRFTNVELIHRYMKVMMGSTLYDAQGNIVSQMGYRYTTGADGQTELEQIHQEVYGTDNTGAAFVTRTDTYIRDLETQYNFKINN